MKETIRNLELLAPARDADIAIEAIKHGADAVYIGPPDFGARKSASNSIDDIKRVVEFAHIFHSKVYITLNTIIFDSEIHQVEKLIYQLYRIGADALIIQDMGILRMDIPPIQLHASTQCDIRFPEKARFLQNVGFSQIVLARELSLKEIREICDVVTIPVETFVHGALCTCLSGRCQAGYAYNGRSGNRGECPQICRLPFILKDNDGKILSSGKHLLSLKDFNASGALKDLIEAGVSSFKIEGRLKDMDYVKNVVAFYSRELNRIVDQHPDKYRRSSFGESRVNFNPDLYKSFNRGFTAHHLYGNPVKQIGSFRTPKSQGEPIMLPGELSKLHPGDGISFFNRKGEYSGTIVNAVRNGKILSPNRIDIPENTEIRRTFDVEWKKLLSKATAERKLKISVKLEEKGASVTDETGAFVCLPFPFSLEPALNKSDFARIFSKLGDTPFVLSDFKCDIQDKFIPASLMTAFRRNMIEKLLMTKRIVYPFKYRKAEDTEVLFPNDHLDYRDNVANEKSAEFYKDHGVKTIENAAECVGKDNLRGKKVMTTRHCILRELNMCRKKGVCKNKLPLFLENGSLRYRLEFDCSNCEMHLIQL